MRVLLFTPRLLHVTTAVSSCCVLKTPIFERSTPEAIEAIMDGMNWLNSEWDEGPYYQTKRFDRYNAVIDQMLEEGTAYKCYCSKERLKRCAKSKWRGEKPRYDGRCRHSHEHHHADDEPCRTFC